MKLHPLLKSSADPQRLSMTIKGALMAIVVGLSFTGIVPTDAVKDVAPATDFIVTGIQAIASAVATIWTVYGGLRKIYNTWFNK